MSTQNTLIALVAGAALGAVAGILLAPASGKETRKNLLKKGESLRGQLSDLVDQGKDLMDEAMSTAKGAAKQAGNAVQDTAEKAKSSYEQAKATAQKA